MTGQEIPAGLGIHVGFGLAAGPPCGPDMVIGIEEHNIQGGNGVVSGLVPEAAPIQGLLASTEGMLAYIEGVLAPIEFFAYVAADLQSARRRGVSS